VVAPKQESGLPLAQEAHNALCEIDALIAGTDRILGAVVEEYPAALAMGKLLSGSKVVSPSSYQTVGATFLSHPAVVSARVKAECRPAPSVSVPLADLEALEKLSKLVFQVNNHLGTFLFRLDKAVERLPAMAQGCLEAASKASQHVAQLAGRMFSNTLLLRRDHYLSGLRASGVVKTYFRSRSVRESLIFGSDFSLVMDKEATKIATRPPAATLGKRRPAATSVKPPPVKKPAFLREFQIPRVSDAGGAAGNVAIPARRARSRVRASRFRATTKGKAPQGGKQQG
jgi:hypothetical protein